MPAFSPVASLPVASVPAGGPPGSVGSVSIGIAVSGVLIAASLYSTDVIARVVMSDSDIVSLFCTLEPPAVEDVISFMPMSGGDVIGDVVVCCDGGS